MAGFLRFVERRVSSTYHSQMSDERGQAAAKANGVCCILPRMRSHIEALMLCCVSRRGENGHVPSLCRDIVYSDHCVVLILPDVNARYRNRSWTSVQVTCEVHDAVTTLALSFPYPAFHSSTSPILHRISFQI
nr:hypothetical protein CFP56_71937 [Quercus suber]